MKTKFYILDISCCTGLHSDFEGVNAIPLVTGTFCYEFDVLESDLPLSLISNRRAFSESTQFSYPHSTCNDSDFMPLGIDRPFPEGSILREV